jgi:hypothetical protein
MCGFAYNRWIVRYVGYFVDQFLGGPMFSLKKRMPSIGVPQNPADASAAHGSVGVRPPRVGPPGKLVAGIGRIMNGAFGAVNSPGSNLSAEVAKPPKQALYQYYEGELFTPGALNWVFEYPFEYALQTVWGNGFLYRPNYWNPLQPAQPYQNPYIVTNGIGGLVAGQLASQPLLTDDSAFV